MATVKSLYLQCLAQGSFVVSDDGNAFIIDPRRDVDSYLDYLDDHNLRCKGVLLTHLHADFISGHAELSRRTGAPVFIGARAELSAAHYPVSDGDTLVLSPKYALRALTTPGHTPGCVTWLLIDRDADNLPVKAFTGDTLFVGSVGRPDLVGSVGFTAEHMAREMYDSLFHKLLLLPDDCEVHPAHGAGSPCGKSLSTDTFSTIGKEKATNPALQFEGKVDDFLSFMTADLPPAPLYFGHCVALNRAGADDVARVLDAVPHLPPLEFAALLPHGPSSVWIGRSEDASLDPTSQEALPPLVIDTREAEEFASAHIPGSLNFPIGIDDGVTLRKEDGNMGIWLGSLIAPSRALFVVAPLGKEAESVRRFARVGFENVRAVLKGSIDAWMDAMRSGEDLSIVGAPRVHWTSDSLDSLVKSGAVVVDVRNTAEYACPSKGHVTPSINVPLHTLPEILHAGETFKAGTTYVTMCSGGFRSAIARSLIESAGFVANDVHQGYDVAVRPIEEEKKRGLSL